ncbi:MAG: Rieske 2Fe-2S domain-containing protein [Cyanobacteriota bacterium]|nr:Rieske 2Fe-2S domain-containing protein [Cyanobacteriota bacterium]
MSITPIPPPASVPPATERPAPALPASGSAASVPPAWRDSWYPVAFLRDLDRSRPTPFTLLGEDLVLWWDRAGGCWQAFTDVCPHRLVPLSEGRLNAAGELECPYHGWSFNGSGRCTVIPQAPPGATPTPRRSSCHRHATAEGQGLLFVFAGDPATAARVPLPLVPALAEDPEGWVVQDTFRDLPMDALTLLENVLDVSHVPFTHHRTVGRRENAAPVEAERTGFGPAGFTLLWQEGPRRGKLGSQHTRFLAPGLLWHDLTARGFARILTVVYAVPIGRGSCRLIARFPFRFEARLPRLLLRLRPLWLQHIGNHTVLEDDQVFLHGQERQLERRGGSAEAGRAFFLATPADRYVKALHDWINRHAGEPFAGQPLPARLDRPALMDRYHSHTVHCRACRGALASIRRWRTPVALLPWLGLLLLILLPHGAGVISAALLLAVAGLGLKMQLDAWEHQLLQGDGRPPRNRD